MEDCEREQKKSVYKKLNIVKWIMLQEAVATIDGNSLKIVIFCYSFDIVASIVLRSPDLTLQVSFNITPKQTLRW